MENFREQPDPSYSDVEFFIEENFEDKPQHLGAWKALILNDSEARQGLREALRRLDAPDLGHPYVPSRRHVLRALTFNSPADIQAIVCGHDPVPNPRLATGLAFSLSRDLDIGNKKRICPAIEIMKKALRIAGVETPKDSNNYNYEHWTERGVLLWNAVLTVPENKSDKKLKHKFWLDFTKRLLLLILTEARWRHSPVLGMFWGDFASEVRNHLCANLHTSNQISQEIKAYDHPTWPRERDINDYLEKAPQQFMIRRDLFVPPGAREDDVTDSKVDSRENGADVDYVTHANSNDVDWRSSYSCGIMSNEGYEDDDKVVCDFARMHHGERRDAFPAFRHGVSRDLVPSGRQAGHLDDVVEPDPSYSDVESFIEENFEDKPQHLGAWKALILNDSEARQGLREALRRLDAPDLGHPYVPSRRHVLRALTFNSPANIQAIVCGHDPVPNPRLATGLAFSLSRDLDVGHKKRICPAIEIMKKALRIAGVETPKDSNNYNYEHWAERGVLLWNAVLTVPENKSDKKLKHKFWLDFTKRLLLLILTEARWRHSPVLGMFWGDFASEVRNHLCANLHTYNQISQEIQAYDHPTWPRESDINDYLEKAPQQFMIRRDLFVPPGAREDDVTDSKVDSRENGGDVDYVTHENSKDVDWRSSYSCGIMSNEGYEDDDKVVCDFARMHHGERRDAFPAFRHGVSRDLVPSGRQAGHLDNVVGRWLATGLLLGVLHLLFPLVREIATGVQFLPP